MNGPSDPQAERRIGDYQIIKKIGTGGLGAVYEVRHVISGRAEAMKVLLPEQRSNPEMVERFQREIQLLASLDHPNIAGLHNAFYYNDHLIMVMELVSGETLRDKFKHTRIASPLALDYASQILSALDFAHRAGVVHRDRKTSNVMITDSNTVKLLDFGIAISDHGADLTMPGFLLGTLNYMSPEQISGGKATTRSDIYSAAVTIYEMLTSAVPITGATASDILIGHRERMPIAPIQIDPRIPQAVSDAIMRGLEKEPGDRFRTANDFAAALQVSRTTEEGRAQYGTNSISTEKVTGPLRPAKIGIDQPRIDFLTKELAEFIGPAAKYVVKGLIPRCSDLEQMYALAAKEIPFDSDRQKFLRRRTR